MMKKALNLFFIFLLVLGMTIVGFASEEYETVIIRVSSKGSAADVARGQNLVRAAEELNRWLAQKNDKRRVKVEHIHDSSGTDDNETNRRFFLAWHSGHAEDIIALPHSNVALYAEGNYALPLDELIKTSEFGSLLEGIYDNLWEAAKYKGRIYAVPQDAEARVLFYRKDVLAQMGWREQEIADLAEKIREGQFTLEDMIALGKQAQEQKLVDWGFYHRPTNGPAFTMILRAFGGEVYNAEADKIVLDKKALTKALAFFRRITQEEKITPEGMTIMEWRNLHQVWVEGDVLFWLGGTWHWGEYQQVPYHSTLGELTEDYMFANMGYALFPAVEQGGRPVTLTNPFVYMINSKTKHPDLAFALVALASQPEYNALHAVNSGHMVISPDAAEQPLYKENAFFKSVAYMLEYTMTQPNTPRWNNFTTALYKAVQAVELGQQTPKEAVGWMEEQLKHDLGDQLLILE